MKFEKWVSLKETEAKKLDEPSMRILHGPMSHAGFANTSAKIAHGEYRSKNFDRYPFKPNEARVSEFAQKMGRMVRGDMLECIEALAGYYGNDGIVKAFDDFLTELSRHNIKP